MRRCLPVVAAVDAAAAAAVAAVAAAGVAAAVDAAADAADAVGVDAAFPGVVAVPGANTSILLTM